MATYTAEQQVQQIYIGLLGRAADKPGLDYWVNQINTGVITIESVRESFTVQPEYTSGLGTLSRPQLVAQLYQNLFERAPEAAGLEYWVNGEGSTVSIDRLVLALSAGASAPDRLVMDNKTEAAVYYTQQAGAGFTLDAAEAAVEDVSGDRQSVLDSKAATDNGTQTSGQTFTLTAGVDNIVGTANNDTINATNTATSSVLGGLDVVNGGAGVDTLNIADTATAATAQFSIPAGFTTQNVENIAVTTNGGVSLNVSGIAGLQTVKTVAAGTANTSVTAAGTTDVTTTVAGNATTAVSGGNDVAVTAGTSGTAGSVTISGAALGTVSVKGGGNVDVDNLGGASGTTTSVGTTLTAVTLDNIEGTTAAVKGAAVNSVTVKNQDSGLATSVTNGTSTSLTVNVDNAGYTALGVAVTGVSVAAGAAATSITVNATGSKSNVTVTGAAAKTVNITGDADLVLAPVTTATKVDGSAATGNLTLGSLAVGTVSASTGAGNDSFTVNATAKATVASGAGNDTVTLGSVLAAGSTVDLGAGNDTLLGSAKPAASTATNVTTIDGGAGTDSVSSALINVGNAAQFVNFENISLAGGALDLNLITGSSITGLSIDSANATTLTNATTAQTLTVNAAAAATTNTIGFQGVTGSSDAYAINFNGSSTGTTAAPTTIDAGTVVVNGIENLTIGSNSAAGVNVNDITLTASTLQTLTITGSQAATIDFAGTNGTISSGVGGVSSIDGSSAAGVLNINTTNVTAAAAGLTVKTGSANDVITLSQKATVEAGAGNDTIVSAAAGGTFTGGAGNDVFDIKAAVGNVTTITDFQVGADKLTLVDRGTETFASTKVDISGATNLTDALNLAAAGTDAANSAVTWFQFGANTYVVQDNNTATTFNAATDIAVQLTGTIDLSTQTVADFNFA